MSILVFIVAIVVVGALVMFVRSRKKSPSTVGGKSWLSSFFEPSSDSLIKKYETATEIEKKKAAKLGQVLKAKKVMMRARAANLKIQQEIDKLTVENFGDEEKPATPTKPTQRS